MAVDFLRPEYVVLFSPAGPLFAGILGLGRRLFNQICVTPEGRARALAHDRMNGFVANTDPTWFELPLSQREVGELNLWMPNRWGGQIHVLRSAEPLFFDKGAVNQIAGGGLFEH